MDQDASQDLILISAEIVAAYVSKNPIRATDLPGLITQVHGALAGLSSRAPQPVETAVTKPTPGQIRKSITPDAITSFIDGKPYLTLKRHLGTHGLSFAEYRERYGLPADYPTVAPSYSARRSELAKSFGLGRPGRSAAAAEPAGAVAEPAPPAAEAEEVAAEKPKRPKRTNKVAEPA